MSSIHSLSESGGAREGRYDQQEEWRIANDARADEHALMGVGSWACIGLLALRNTQVSGESSGAIHLVRQVARQDREAFSQLYDRCSSLVFTLAMRMLKERSDAEDLLQEVFVQVWRQAANYNEERGSPEAWIVNIARSRTIDKLRSIRRREQSFMLTDDPARAESDDNVESSAAESEAKLTMNSALANLPEAQRKVLELAYFDGLTQTEIAQRLSEPLGTVKTRIRAGIQRLREMLKAQAV